MFNITHQKHPRKPLFVPPPFFDIATERPFWCGRLLVLERITLFGSQKIIWATAWERFQSHFTEFLVKICKMRKVLQAIATNPWLSWFISRFTIRVDICKKWGRHLLEYSRMGFENKMFRSGIVVPPLVFVGS